MSKKQQPVKRRCDKLCKESLKIKSNRENAKKVKWKSLSYSIIKIIYEQVMVLFLRPYKNF